MNIIVSALLIALLAPDTVRSTVQVVVRGPDGYASMCGGVVINAVKGEVLTAAHCLPDTEDKIIFVDDKPSKVLKVGGELALVSSEPFVKPAITIATVTAKVGDGVVSYGYGLGLRMRIVRNVAAVIEGERLIILDGPLSSGMSGGPVVNVSGLLVGLNQGTEKATSVISSSKAIREFLNAK